MKAQSATLELFQPTPSVIERPQPFLEVDEVRQRSTAERAMPAQLQQKDVLLREVQHRVANSLQIIATLLALDARRVSSDETRLHLQNAQRRILAVATVQRNLDTSRHGDELELSAYLHQLCGSLTDSVVGDATRIAINVHADACRVSSKVAMSLGLIVTELVINALKHAFTADTATGLIAVTYRVEGDHWRLTVSDNGVGKPNGEQDPTSTGLGTAIVAALVKQLHGRVHSSTDSHGRSVSITHGSF